MLPRTDLIRWDTDTDEAYILLPSFPDLRLTPWRVTDRDEAVVLFNDPSIGEFGYRRPFPYLSSHFDYVINTLIPTSTKTTNLLRPIFQDRSDRSDPLPRPIHSSFDEEYTIHSCPFSVIRDESSGKAVGEMKMYQPLNHSTPRRGSWDVGYNLLPEFRGRGISGEALELMVEAWAKWVGIESLVAVSKSYPY